jgi:glycosyltransferase involved in cell wall biosynthesis
VPIRVYLPCTGLGRQQRGFETFTREFAGALRGDPRLDVTVFSGARVPRLESRSLWNLSRDSMLARAFSGVHRRGAYFSEQATFFIAFLPHLIVGRPDVVYFADPALGEMCRDWRVLSRQRYRLLYYNGGATTTPFAHADFVQQLTAPTLAAAVAQGERAERQTVLPQGVKVPATLPSTLDGTARVALGLPTDRAVVLSVGLIGTGQKRMEYLIAEVAALPEPRPFLCLLGEDGEGAATVRGLAGSMLGASNVMIRAVPHTVVGNYYRAADVFILASLHESLGLAYLEALARGSTVIAHDSEGTRQLLGSHAVLRDLTVTGEGTRAIRAALARPASTDARYRRWRYVRDRYGWQALREGYVHMFEQVMALPR